MSEHEKLENRDLVKRIISLCQQQASGTVFIVTEDNHLARVVLIQGKIVCASLQRMEGIKAIKALSNLASGAFGFNPDLQVVTRKQILPDTNSLLQILQSGVVNQSPLQTDGSSQQVAQLPASPEILHVMVQESTEYLGPMASILCQEYMQDLPDAINLSHIQQVIRLLERDINNPEKADKFNSAVRNRLGI